MLELIGDAASVKCLACSFLSLAWRTESIESI